MNIIHHLEEVDFKVLPDGSIELIVDSHYPRLTLQELEFMMDKADEEAEL